MLGLSKTSIPILMVSLATSACVNIPPQASKPTSQGTTDMSSMLDMGGGGPDETADLKELPSREVFFVGTYSLEEVFGIDRDNLSGQVSVQTNAEGFVSYDDLSGQLTFNFIVLDEGFELTLSDQGGVVTTLTNVRVDGWVKLVTGRDHTCGVSARERVYCWGRNNHGQIGVSPGPERRTPVRIRGALTVENIISGSDHLVAIAPDGQLWGWGLNASLQLQANNASPMVLEPQRLSVPIGLLLDGGEESSCYFIEGSVKCYGLNAAAPWELTGETWVAMSAAGDRYCGFDLSTPQARCYTVTNPAATRTPDALELSVTELDGGIAASAHFTCVWSASEVYCQAQDIESNDARVGNLSKDGPLKAWRVFDDPQGARVVSVALGDKHGCLLNDLGEIYCWGLASEERLGFEGAADSDLALPLTRLGQGWVSISSKHDHTCAVNEQGRAVCWGLNTYGQLGAGEAAQAAPASFVSPPKAP